MNADSERAFDSTAARAGRSLWPGRIRLGGRSYDVSLTRNPVLIRHLDGDAAGVREVAGCQVELDKLDHPAEPAPETIFADLGDGGRLYRIQRVGGRGDQDAVWFLEGVVEDR